MNRSVRQQDMHRKEVTISGKCPELSEDMHPLELARYLAFYLLRMDKGALYGRWDEQRQEGVWFHSPDKTASFSTPPHAQVIFTDRIRARFRGVIFRLACLGSDGSELCGYISLRSEDGSISRRHAVHASFDPQFGLWMKAAVFETRDEQITV